MPSHPPLTSPREPDRKPPAPETQGEYQKGAGSWKPPRINLRAREGPLVPTASVRSWPSPCPQRVSGSPRRPGQRLLLQEEGEPAGRCAPPPAPRRHRTGPTAGRQAQRLPDTWAFPRPRGLEDAPPAAASLTGSGGCRLQHGPAGQLPTRRPASPGKGAGPAHPHTQERAQGCLLPALKAPESERGQQAAPASSRSPLPPRMAQPRWGHDPSGSCGCSPADSGRRDGVGDHRLLAGTVGGAPWNTAVPARTALLQGQGRGSWQPVWHTELVGLWETPPGHHSAGQMARHETHAHSGSVCTYSVSPDCRARSGRDSLKQRPNTRQETQTHRHRKGGRASAAPGAVTC